MRDSQNISKQQIQRRKSFNEKLEIIGSNDTSRKKAEQVMQLVGNEWDITTNAISDWVSLIDLEGRVLRTNKSGRKFTGLPSTKIVGQSCCKLTHGSTKRISGCPLEEMIRTGQRANAELQLPDGRRWFSFTVDPITDEKSNIRAAIHIVRDITQQKRIERALRIKEAAIATSINAIALADLHRIMTYVNDAFLKMWGYDNVGEVLGKPAGQFWKIDDEVKNKVKTLRHGGGWIDEVPAQRKDGSFFVVQLSTTVVSDENLMPVYMMTSFIDITERKKVEEKLRESEERHRTILKIALDGFLINDLEGRLLEVNDSYCNMTGYTREELLAMSIPDIEAMEKPEDTAQHIKKIMEQGYDHFETQHKRKDGKIIDLEISSNYIDVGQGQIFASVRDITERKKSEDALRKSEKHYRMLAESMNDGLAQIDENGIKIYANKRCAEIFGYSPKEMLGKHWTSFYDEDSRHIIEEQWGQRKKGIAESYEILTIRKDGRKIYLSISPQPIFDENDKFKGSISILTDITERKRAEESLRENEELFRTFIEKAPEAIFVHDLDGQILIVNDLACKYTAYSKDALLTINVSDIDAEIIEKEHRKRYWEKLQTGEYITIKGIHRRKDRSTYPAEIHLVKITLHGKPMILAFVRDITERKRAEAALLEREELLKATLESTADGILVVNDKGRVTHSNARMMKMWRVPKKLFETGDDAKLLPFKAEQLTDPVGFLTKVENLYQSSEEDFDTLYFKDGRVFERYSCPLIRDGKNVGRVWSFRDVTEHKQSEKSLLEYHEQLKSLASQLTLTEERERRRIASELHDQISQSLAISKIKLEELLHSDLSYENSMTLRDVCNWLSKAVTDTRSLTFDLSSPILYELGFEKAVDAWLVEEIQRKHNIITEFHNDGKPKQLEDDVRMLLFRDVRELLINIVKHARAKKAKVSIKKVDNMIQVRVEDDGVGFNPTEVLSTKIAAFGLFSIRERLKYLGGRFEINSEPGSGCRITMWAPLKQKMQNEEDKR